MNQPGLDLLQYKLALNIHVMLDIYHRCWNDLKGAMKASSGALFRVMLQFSIFYNVNYGPAGSRAWMQRKIQQTQEFMDRFTAFDKMFTDYVPLICEERGVPEPQSPEDLQRLFDEMKTLKTLHQHGPCVKLMRWFSFFESHQHFSGECWINKMIMSFNVHGGETDPALDETQTLLSELDSGNANLTHAQELRQLKCKLGVWALAPRLVSGESMWKNKLLNTIAQPCWNCFATKAKTVKSPDEVQSEFATKAGGPGWAQEAFDLLEHGFHKFGNLYSGQSFAADNVPGK